MTSWSSNGCLVIFLIVDEDPETMSAVFKIVPAIDRHNSRTLPGNAHVGQGKVVACLAASDEERDFFTCIRWRVVR